MAGLYHDFLLLSRAEHRFEDYSQFINDPGAIRLHDDLIGYLYDSLLWIPTLNPARNEAYRGLCHFGPTVIHTEGAAVAATVFSSWAALFACGPETLELTGRWITLGERPAEGEYEKLVDDRDDLVRRLRQIADYARRILESNGECFILHQGI